jgi:hypothetical protein
MESEYMRTVAAKAGEQISDLVFQNLPFMTADADSKDSDKCAASISLNLERGPNGFTVKTKLTYTSRTTDEIEGYVDRPDQVKINFKAEKKL